MHLSVPDDSAPTPIQSSSSPLDALTSGFLSSVGSGIEDWTQPFERLSGMDKFGDADLSQGILNKDDYEKLPYAIPGGWHPGITPVQAFVESSKHEQDQKFAAYSEAHPVKAFGGSMIGEALNPLWWVGAGELAGAGPIIGRIGGESVLGKLTEAGVAQGIQAAGITAVEQGANELTGHEADPSSIIKNFATGLVLGGAAHGIQLALRPQVAAMQDIADSVESGKPLDAANKVFPESPEVTVMPTAPGAEGIGEEPELGDFGGVENNASGESAASLEAIHRLQEEARTQDRYWMVSAGGNIRPIIRGVDAVDTHPRADEIKVVTSGSKEPAVVEVGASVTHAGGQERLGYVRDKLVQAHAKISSPEEEHVGEYTLKQFTTDSAPNTIPVGGHKPVIQAAEQAAKDQQTLAEEIAQKPVKAATGAAKSEAGTGGAAVKPSPAAAEAATPQFPAGIQEGYEADLADSNKMKVMADALKQALGCRLNG